MKYRNGFTLVEVIVVLSILALLATTITIQLGRRSQDEEYIERIRYVIETAAEQADMRGVPLRLELSPKGYQFSRVDTAGNWGSASDDPLLSTQKFPDGIVWTSLEIDGQPAPAQIVLSGGEIPAFVLHFDTPAGSVRLISTPTGAIRIDNTLVPA